MKVIDIYRNAETPPISYEIIPPKRGESVQEILDLVEELMPYEPPFIDVTSHSAQAWYEELPDGTIKRHIKRKRPGTIGICAAIQNRFGIPTVPHLLCLGFTREETEDALIELNYLGINNLMALRGDDNGFRKPVRPDRTVNQFAEDLVNQIAAMNRGEYLEDLIDAARTDFCVGVAGYPEKHFEAPNLSWDILNLKRKVEAGADYVVTQMFFRSEDYFTFVEKCRAVGIDVPVVPGIKILTSKRHLQTLPGYFHVGVPEELAAEAEAADDDQVADVGVKWAVSQCDELLSGGAPGVHFYIMKRANTVKRVVEALREMA